MVEKQFETQAFLVLTKTASLSSMLDGDGEVAASSNQQIRASAANPTKPKPIKQKIGKAKSVPQHTTLDGAMGANRKGKALCPGFQDGTCTQTLPSSIVCAANQSLVHQCARCLSPFHGINHPKPCTEKQATPKTKGGKGRGKGKKSGGK